MTDTDRDDEWDAVEDVDPYADGDSDEDEDELVRRGDDPDGPEGPGTGPALVSSTGPRW
jgi:hypothetical protein